MLVLMEKWRNTNKHFVEQDTQCPNIDCEIVTLSFKHFRTEILSSSTEWCSQFSRLNFSSKTKISEQKVPIFIEKDILWLQISINDLFFVEMTKGYCNLSYHESSFLFFKSTDFNQMPKKLTTFDKIHQKENSELILEHVIHWNNEGMVNFI